jgi:hypothetical protein
MNIHTQDLFSFCVHNDNKVEWMSVLIIFWLMSVVRQALLEPMIAAPALINPDSLSVEIYL